VPQAEFGHAVPHLRFDECSYFSEFFLAKDTLVPEIFVAGKRSFPIATTCPGCGARAGAETLTNGENEENSTSQGNNQEGKVPGQRQRGEIRHGLVASPRGHEWPGPECLEVWQEAPPQVQQKTVLNCPVLRALCRPCGAASPLASGLPTGSAAPGKRSRPASRESDDLA